DDIRRGSGSVAGEGQFHIAKGDVHVIGGPARLDAVLHVGMPPETADLSIGPDGGFTAGTGAKVAFDVGIADANGVRQAPERGHVAIVFDLRRIIETERRAVIWISRVKAVGDDVVAIHFDLFAGDHRFDVNLRFLRGRPHDARDILNAGSSRAGRAESDGLRRSRSRWQFDVPGANNNWPK